MVWDKFSKIPLVCPSCLENLEYGNETLICLKCKIAFNIVEGIPIVLDQEFFDSNPGTTNQFQNTDKTFMQELYNNISKELNSNAAAKVFQFINFGYIPNDNSQYSRDFFNNQIINKNSIKLLGEAIGSLNLDEKRILDVGCGRGGVINNINKHYRPEISIGLDISYENILFSKNNNKREDVLLLVGDAENLPFPECSFDVVINIESSLNYPNLNKFYRQIYRILNTGGCFIYSDSIPTAEMESRENYLKNLGFSIIRNTDATSNVLLSLEEIANRSTLAKKISNNGHGLYLNNNFLALPDSEKYRLLSERVCTYKIYHLLK